MNQLQNYFDAWKNETQACPADIPEPVRDVFEKIFEFGGFIGPNNGKKLNTQPANNPLDNQVGGDHYKKLGQYQPWEVLARWLTPDELRGFAKGTVIAYLARERDKGGDADIAKALHTLQLWQALKHTNAPESTP